MISDIKDIKMMRQSLNITQKELARDSGVSQSSIAKIEAGLLDPSYSNARKIILTLEGYRDSKKIVAKNIMNEGVYFLKVTDSTKSIVNLFRETGISQAPVREKGLIVGLITERDLINSIDSKKVMATDIMRDAPPFVNLDTPLEPVKSLLMHFSCVLVADRGKVLGIITNSDLLACKEC